MAGKKKSKALEPIPKESEEDPKVPLSGGFMIASIIGLVISVTYTLSGRFQHIFAWAGENAGYTWGFAFILLFLVMFIASIVSITPTEKHF
ncbi:MAG: hypothetical protein ACQEP1_01800 [Nanobdellota archaeon]